MKGCDAGKHIQGRKRHILVDTLGLLLAVAVTSAAVQQDRDGAKLLLRALGGGCKKRRRAWAAQRFRFAPEAALRPGQGV